jgi:hypothetical protein
MCKYEENMDKEAYWKNIREWEEYQVMCEARVFSSCPDCKKDWEDCTCQGTVNT